MSKLINGVPHIRGTPATEDFEAEELTREVFSKWRCPVCKSHLAHDPPHICLNGCHLGVAGLRSFHNDLSDFLEGVRSQERE